jgi:hypothetical protein
MAKSNQIWLSALPQLVGKRVYIYFIFSLIFNLWLYISSVNIYQFTINKDEYCRITSKQSPSFCMTAFSASLTYLTLLPQSRDSSCYVSRPILAPPPLWLHKHTDLRAHDFAQSPGLWHQHRLTNVTRARSWRLCGINPAVAYYWQDSLSLLSKTALPPASDTQKKSCSWSQKGLENKTAWPANCSQS